jgi:hypothetical protein
MSNPTKNIFGAFFRLEKKATPFWFEVLRHSRIFGVNFTAISSSFSSKFLPNVFLTGSSTFLWYLIGIYTRSLLENLCLWFKFFLRERRSFFFEVQEQMTSECDCSLTNTRMYND